MSTDLKKKTDKIKTQSKIKKLIKKELPKKKVKIQKERKVSASLLESNQKKDQYFESVGRRKTAVARTRIFFKPKDKAVFLINEKDLDKYFQTKELKQIVLSPINLISSLDEFKVLIKVKGGGMVSQAEAIRHGIARCLILIDPGLRKKLKSKGYLKRDPRMRERKKFGLKRARRAPQWSKR